MSEIPSVNVLNSLELANGGTGEAVLVYEDLGQSAVKYARNSGARFYKFSALPAGSLDELMAAKQVAGESLVRTADKVVEGGKPDRQNLWADRFTEASIELYGEPDKTEAHRLVKEQYDWLQEIKDNPDVDSAQLQLLLGVYKPLLESFDTSEIDPEQTDRREEALQAYGEAIKERWSGIFEIIDDVDQSELEGGELRQLFCKIHEWCIKNDEADWSMWSVINGKGTSPRVSPEDKTTKIPDNNLPVSKDSLPGLVAHEWLVHTLRSINGYKTGNEKLGQGLAGNIDVEEGIAIFTEQAAGGIELHRHRDRYVDTALALGTLDGRQRTREEIFEIAFARWLVREQAEGTYSEKKRASLERKAWNRADRIYRGGLGESTSKRQAIFTKDAIYYSGFLKIADYIADQLSKGKSAIEILEDISRAKSDPTDPQHREAVDQAYNLVG